MGRPWWTKISHEMNLKLFGSIRPWLKVGICRRDSKLFQNRWICINHIESEPVFNPHPIFTPLVGVKCIQIIFDSLCHALKLMMNLLPRISLTVYRFDVVFAVPNLNEPATGTAITHTSPVSCYYDAINSAINSSIFRENVLFLDCQTGFVRPNVGSLNFTFWSTLRYPFLWPSNLK